MSQRSSSTQSRDPSTALRAMVCPVLFTLLTSGLFQTAQAQSPVPDAFNPNANYWVYSLAVQSDGKILVGGSFSTLGGQARTRIARMNVDGTLDSSFNPAANDTVRSIAVQPDGRILVGGHFATLNGQARSRIARLTSNGTLDGSFNPGAAGGPYPDVLSLTVQSDSKILVGGDFATLGGQPRTNIGRLNADGTPDLGFHPNADKPVTSIAVQPDGKILVGGNFTTLAGQQRNGIGRLSADGTLDPSFNPDADRSVFSLAVQNDGKILMGGLFTTVGGQARARVARLNADGSLDLSFNPGANGVPVSLVLQADGRIVVGGDFTTFGGEPHRSIARLSASGTPESSFNLGTDATVLALAVQADGKILAGGDFTSIGGQLRNRIARVSNAGPAVDALSYDGDAIVWLRGGTAPEVWRTTFEHSVDGEIWTMLGSGARIPGGWQHNGMPLTLGSIRARGYTAGGYGNESGGLVESVISAPMIHSHPASRVTTAGTAVTFTVGVVGSAPFSYQWRKAGTNLTDGGTIVGATTAAVSVSGVVSRDAGGYDIIVSNAYGSVTSAVAMLVISCNLNVDYTFGGSVMRTPDLPAYPAGSMVTLSATPTAGYGFIRWSGDAIGSANPLDVSLETNKNISAVFASTSLLLSKQGEGTITKSPNQPYYDVGQSVRMDAAPGRWHFFSGWSDGVNNNPRSVTIGENNAYTAVFMPATPLEAVSIGGVDRLAPVGMPAVLVDEVFILVESASARGFAWLMVTSTFPNSTLLYTVDGFDPALVGTHYTGPFSVEKSCLLRTIAYNADFSQSVAGDPLSVVILPTLTGLTDGGGSVAIEPNAGAYFSNSIALVTASTNPGWSFLHWLGDVTGTNPVLSLTMTRNKRVQAVFGTPLNTTVVGGGSIVIDPTASAYSFGSTVRLTAVPANGNYLAFWANAANGMTNNPLAFTVTNANPTVTAVFTSLGGGQTNSLTVIPNGSGQVSLTPPGNRFPRNTNVVLHAVPDAGQDFLGWSGAASGTQNPLVVTTTSNTVLTANFTKRPQLQGEGDQELLGQEGFRLTLTGDWGVAYRIDHSTNLTEWTPLTMLTNTFGTVQFTDGAGTNSPRRFYRAVTPP